MFTHSVERHGTHINRASRMGDEPLYTYKENGEWVSKTASETARISRPHDDRRVFERWTPSAARAVFHYTGTLYVHHPAQGGMHRKGSHGRTTRRHCGLRRLQ